ENEQSPDAERHIGKIKHGKLLPEWAWTGCATKARQGSIPIVGREYKESVRNSGARPSGLLLETSCLQKGHAGRRRRLGSQASLPALPFPPKSRFQEQAKMPAIPGCSPLRAGVARGRQGFRYGRDLVVAIASLPHDQPDGRFTESGLRSLAMHDPDRGVGG